MTPVHLASVGLIAPGLPCWAAARAVIMGERGYEPGTVPQPAADMLPANERRRAAVTVRWALAAAQEAAGASGYPADRIATVFASSGGDGETLHGMCEALAAPGREVSPTRFHNSVHNAPAGYWSIAAGSRLPSATVCGYDASFSVGLFEAALQVAVDRLPVLLVAYDLPYPEPLRAVRPVATPFAVAVVLEPEPRAGGVGSARMELRRGAIVTPFPERLAPLADNPAAQALPLLAGLISGAPQTVRLKYVGGWHLAMDLAA